jgi:hypothetical protein
MNRVAQVLNASMQRPLQQMQEPETEEIETQMEVASMEIETISKVQTPQHPPQNVRHISLHNSSRHTVIDYLYNIHVPDVRLEICD